MGPSFARAQACVFLIVIAAIPAHAGDAAPYVGVWVLELRNCGEAQSSPNAPMLIAEGYYDQRDTHCTFRSVVRKGGDFRISADCSVAGSKKAAEFTLTVSGDTLTFTDESGARDFLRCK